MSSISWSADQRVDLIADPDQAYQDVRDAHAWATREMQSAPASSPRAYILTQERKRLADIAWRLKRIL